LYAKRNVLSAKDHSALKKSIYMQLSEMQKLHFGQLRATHHIMSFPSAKDHSALKKLFLHATVRNVKIEFRTVACKMTGLYATGRSGGRTLWRTGMPTLKG